MKQFMLPKSRINGDVFEVRRLIFEMINIGTYNAVILWRCAAKTVGAYHLSYALTDGLFKRPAVSKLVPIEFLIVLAVPKCKLAIVSHIIKDIGYAHIKRSNVLMNSIHSCAREIVDRNYHRLLSRISMFTPIQSRFDKAIATLMLMHIEFDDATKGEVICSRQNVHQAQKLLKCAILSNLPRTIKVIHRCAQFSSDFIGKILKEMSLYVSEATKRAVRSCYHPNGTSVLVRQCIWPYGRRPYEWND